MARQKLDIPKLLKDLGVPEEVSTREAAEILGCDRASVLRHIREGHLEWRDVSTPGSSRPMFRIKLDGVLAIRTAYKRMIPAPPPRRKRVPTRVVNSSACPARFAHLPLWS